MNQQTQERTWMIFNPYSDALLAFWYVAIFVSAEAAFILMALKEYLQDLIGATEADLIGGLPDHQERDEAS
jgi:hypothetical protein